MLIRESYTMQQSAESNTTGKTMGGIVKRNALSINKSWTQHHNSDGILTNFPTVRSYTVPTGSGTQSLPTNRSFALKDFKHLQYKADIRTSDAE